MGDYRVCHNTAPHSADWWTVERRVRGLFGRWKWVAARKLVAAGPMGPITRIICHESREKALEWIAEDRKPRTHTCEEV